MTEFASFFAVFFAGLFVAALFVSYIADHSGRRSVFAFALIWFGVANFIVGLQDTANNVNVWRFVSARMVINTMAVAFSASIMLFADRLECRVHCAASCFFIAVFGIWFAIVESPAALIVLGACLSMST